MCLLSLSKKKKNDDLNGCESQQGIYFITKIEKVKFHVG